MLVFNFQNKKQVAVWIIVILAVLLGAGTWASSWKVKYVVDGDTIVVQKGRQESTIRLLGIDAPEIAHEKYGKTKGDCYGKEATDFLKEEIGGQNVVLLEDPNAGDKDKYGRSLRYVLADGKIINAEMVRNGYAFVYQYSDFFFAKWFYSMEKQAKNERLGLWGKTCQYYFK